MSRIVTAISGGVDSSVAAALLKEAGHEVIGVFLCRVRPFSASQASLAPSEGCKDRPLCGDMDALSDDAAGARRVADSLGIPLHVLDMEDEFQGVFDYFVDEYAAGRTPNPCIVCNARIKFGAVFQFARSIGAERLATGHHARTLNSARSEATLCRGRDPGKDQSYFLFGVDRAVLPKLIFPVGDYLKAEIRRMAAELGLHTAATPDSQDICFLSGIEHSEFVQRALRKRGQNGDVDRGGPVKTADGTVVGRHQGIERFTVGQRKGIGVALGEPHYVIRIEADTRRVVLGSRDQLACNELTARGANWLFRPADELSPGETFRAEVKIRYRSRPLPATVEILSPEAFRVRFDSPCLGAAPGQAAVCYHGETVLGGGWIE